MKKYHSLRDYVRRHISDGIHSGELKPGDRISEQGLAEELQVSRTPAREALMRLEAEGLLTYRPRRGFAIKEVTPREIRDNFELIALLDAFAADRALDHLRETDLQDLREGADKIDLAIKYQNRADYRLLQRQFHELYRRRCPNRMVLQLLDQLEGGLTPEVFVGRDTPRLFEFYRRINLEHRRIIELLEKRDRPGLFDFLQNHHWNPDRAEVDDSGYRLAEGGR